MTKMTGVSVVIPLYNKERYVKRAVDSVISQTHQCFEILVVNDGSTDGGPVKVAEIKDDRIKIIHQDNLGESAARNKGISEAKYELIAFLDADDQWEPEFLENCVHILNVYSDAAMVGTAFKIVKSKVDIRYPEFKFVPEEHGLIENYFKAALIINPICSSAVVVRKEVFYKIGFFTEGMQYGPDSFMWSKISLNYPVAFINNYLASVYLNIDNRVSKQHEMVNDFPLFKYISSLDKKIEDVDYYYIKEYIYKKYLLIAGRYLYTGNKKMARHYLLKAQRTELNKMNYMLGRIALNLPYPMFKKVAGIWSKNR